MATPAESVLVQVEQGYRRRFAAEPIRASVSFVGVEPMEVLRFSEVLGQTYVSLGMSRYPTSAADSVLVDRQDGPRAELMISAVDAPDELWRQLAILAAAPAVQSTVYQIGDRVQLEAPLAAGSRCVGGLVAISGIPAVELADGSTVDVLQLLPTTGEELAFARVHGNDALIARWQSAGTALRNLVRSSVDLA